MTQNAKTYAKQKTQKTKPKPTHKFKNCSRVCTNVVHNTAQNSSDILSS